MRKIKRNLPVANIQQQIDEAYQRGVGDASTSVINSADIKRSYNALSLNSAQSHFTDAQSIIASSFPTKTKDKHYTDRHSEIKTSRAMTDGNVWMARYLQSASARIYGKSGARLKSKMTYKSFLDGKLTDVPHELATELTQALWQEFIYSHNIDVAKLRTWNDFIGEDVSNGIPRDGSLLWLVHCFDPNSKNAPNKFGTALQQFDILRIQQNLNLPSDINGVKVINGIEINKFGARTAVYIDLNNDTQAIIGGESLKQYKNTYKNTHYLRIPILDELNYKYDGIYAIFYDNDPSPLPEQVWGRPWASVAIPYMHSDAKLDYALQVAAIAGASKSVVIRRDASGNAPAQNIVRNSDGSSNVQIVPGQVNILDQGQQIDTIDFDLPYDGTLRFSQKTLRGVASSLAIPYPELTSDYDRSSYSVENSAEVRNNRLWHQRRNHIITNLLQPLIRFWYRRVVHFDLYVYFDGTKEVALSKPMLYDMSKCLNFQFDNIERPSTLEDEKATELRLSLGLTTLDDEILNRGNNPDDIYKKRKAEIQKLNDDDITINGYNYNIEKQKYLAKIYEVDTQKEIALKGIESKQQVDSKLETLKDEVTLNRNIQQTILRNLTDLGIDLDTSKKDDLMASIASIMLSTKDKETVDNRAIVRRYSVTERPDGTFDLNTLKVIEEKADLEVTQEEVKPIIEESKPINPLEEISTEFNNLLEEIKNINI